MTAGNYSERVMSSQMTYSVPGMSCEHCRAAVECEVGAVPGVALVEVDLGSKLVQVTGDGFAEADIRRAIDEAGFDTE